jgi:hypothetical protein
MTSRKHPSATFWVTVVVVVALVAIASYPLSLGPAIWLRDRGIISEAGFESVSAPLVILLQMLPDPVGNAIYEALDSYVILWE